ncbi:MAG: hypothetical protein KF814_14110 [Nitrospiraceae bacterium]|nr:hypothetical protein [Nitrospiraceae bacterium]
MTKHGVRRLRGALLGLLFVGLFSAAGMAWSAEPDAESAPRMTPVPGTTAPKNHLPGHGPAKTPPLLMAEGSNSCEIVSCGMGIKQTCQITCPADQTPKCSCDCVKNFGPMCTEYKANCRCE